MSEQMGNTTRTEVKVVENNSVDELCLRARRVFDFVAHFGLKIVNSTPAQGKPYVFCMTVEGNAEQLRKFGEAMLLGFIPGDNSPVDRFLI